MNLNGLKHCKSVTYFLSAAYLQQQFPSRKETMRYTPLLISSEQKQNE